MAVSLSSAACALITLASQPSGKRASPLFATPTQFALVLHDDRRPPERPQVCDASEPRHAHRGRGRAAEKEWKPRCAGLLVVRQHLQEGLQGGGAVGRPRGGAHAQHIHCARPWREADCLHTHANAVSLLPLDGALHQLLRFVQQLDCRAQFLTGASHRVHEQRCVWRLHCTGRHTRVQIHEPGRQHAGPNLGETGDGGGVLSSTRARDTEVLLDHGN